MAENKKFLDAAGLEYFWRMCRLQSGEDFQTNLAIFDAMAKEIANLRDKAGVDELPSNITSIFELVSGQTITELEKDYENGEIRYTTMDGENHVFSIPKFYSETGNNEDGTMTQKAITDALNEKVGVEFDNNTKTLIFK